MVRRGCWRVARRGAAPVCWLLACLLLICLPGSAFSQFPSVGGSGGRGSGAGAEADTTDLPMIEYNANAIEYVFSDSSLVMTGSAELQYGDVELTAGRLRYHTYSELLTADFLPPSPDIDPETNTYPRLEDEMNVVVGDRMQYDMKTREGRIWQGRTQYEEGFFTGELMRLNADQTFDMEGATYTTCDNPNHLHYYLRINEAKVVPDDKAVIRNVTGYVFGIPVFYLPVYVFSVKSGRHSGFTIPNYGSGVEEGRYLRNLGYYWAPNEYLDLKVTGDIEAKTGFLLKPRFQYRQDRRIRGSASGSWQTDFSGKTTGWDVAARHRQELLPGLTVRGQTNFAQSMRYLHSTTRGTDPGRLRSNTRSSFAIDKRFGRNSLNLSTSTSSTTGRPSRPTTTLRFRFATRPIIQPPKRQTRRGSMPDFKRPRTEIEERWYHTFLFGFNNTLRNRRNNVRLGRDTTYTGPDTRYLYRHDTIRTFSNAFNLSAPQKLMGWLKLRPQARYTRTWEQDTGEESDQKIETKEDHSVGMSATTTLYGLFQPRIGRLNAIRHVVTPLVSFTQTGGRSVRKSLRFSLDNILQARTEHENREKKYNLMYVKSSTSYNFQADARKLADLSTSVRIPSRRLNLNLSMNHDFYDPETDAFRRPWLERLSVSTSLNLVGPRQDRRGFGDDEYGGYDDGYGGYGRGVRRWRVRGWRLRRGWLRRGWLWRLRGRFRRLRRLRRRPLRPALRPGEGTLDGAALPPLLDPALRSQRRGGLQHQQPRNPRHEPVQPERHHEPAPTVQPRDEQVARPALDQLRLPPQGDRLPQPGPVPAVALLGIHLPLGPERPQQGDLLPPQPRRPPRREDRAGTAQRG